MVASIAAMSKGQETYYTQLAREDYYLKGGEPPGKWLGNAAKTLGLEGEISSEQLSAALAGFSPDGKKLVRNAGYENRQVGWDMTFSAPKDVSILWGIGTDEERDQLEAAHSAAVETAVEYLQQNVIWSRTGEGGKDWMKAEALVASFLHGTSRDVDPNLHTHSLFINLGLREDGKTGSIVSKKLYQHKMIAGLIYRAALAETLSNKLGLELEQEKSWFHIKGVSKEARDHFSKRSQAIKAVAGEDATQAEKDRATLHTRSIKGHIARNEIHPLWKRQAEGFGLTNRKISGLFQPNKPVAVKEPLEQAQERAVKELSDSESYFRSEDLLRSTLEEMKLGEQKVEDVLKFHESSLKTDRFHSLGEDQKSQYFASEKQVGFEKQLLDLASNLNQEKGNPISQAHVKAVIKGSKANQLAKTVCSFINDRLPERLQFKYEGTNFEHLNGKQKAALKNLTTTGGKLKTVSGRAGTGKTTLLAAARESWESKGFKVVGCAVSGKAAQELASGAGMDSETVAYRLMQLKSPLARFLSHEAKQLLRAFVGKHRQSREQFKLTSKTVLVIDEASMLYLPHKRKTRHKFMAVTRNHQALTKFMYFTTRKQIPYFILVKVKVLQNDLPTINGTQETRLESL